MAQKAPISGFSKLSPEEKVQWLSANFDLPPEILPTLKNHLHSDPDLQGIYGELSENTLSNFYFPYGIAPNFLINNRWYAVPMVIEESSIVAAASHAAKFWSAHGGFNADIIGSNKTGQVHFFWTGDKNDLFKFFEKYRPALVQAAKIYSESMEKRGGGILSLELADLSDRMDHLFQLKAKFRTADAMGANFINTVLEALAQEWEESIEKEGAHYRDQLEINMAILSNYTPESRVKVGVECNIDSLSKLDQNGSGRHFAEKFVRAVGIANVDPFRAVTHNKGIFNGMDAVVLSTGNDFRAVEACGHAYASRNGDYQSLSDAWIEGNTFHFELDVAMAVGTVGGLTKNHPLAKISLQILGNPDAEKLMMIIAAAGIANNFSALRSLITSGIQKGHMKMHLKNILRQLGATEKEREKALLHFSNKTVSFSEVKAFLLRKSR